MADGSGDTAVSGHRDDDHAGMRSPDLSLDYVEALLRETRDELARTDTKASILLAATGIAVGSFLGGSWRPADLWSGIEWLFWLAATLIAIGVTLLGLVVLPDTRPKGSGDAVVFFGQVARYTSREQFAAAMGGGSVSAIDRAIDQLWFLSRVVASKYRRIRLAMLLFAIASAAFVLTILTDGFAAA